MAQSNDPIHGRIFVLRSHRVILDADLARLYRVPTFRLNEAVKRNVAKFPDDFRFQLNEEELAVLISQNAISSSGHGGVRKRPWAFTEHGALMAANVLRSPRATQMAIYVVRAFIMQREAVLANVTMLKRLAQIDKTLLEHDSALLMLWGKLKPLLEPPPDLPDKEMGFHTQLKKP